MNNFVQQQQILGKIVHTTSEILTAAIKVRQSEIRNDVFSAASTHRYKYEKSSIDIIAKYINLPILGKSQFLTACIYNISYSMIQLITVYDHKIFMDLNHRTKAQNSHIQNIDNILYLICYFRIQNTRIMEKQNNKEGYLQYFPKADRFNCSMKSKNPLNPKILPHIAEQYQFRITNHLLINKIISPKRDKIIMNSLQGIKKNCKNHKNKSLYQGRMISRSRQGRIFRGQIRDRSIDQRSKTAEQSLKHGDSSHNTQSLILMENHNGRFSSIKKRLQIEQQQKKNQGCIRSFYVNRQNSLKRRIAINSNSILSQTFGFGPTILSIFHLQIKSNPTIKKGILLELELIQKASIKINEDFNSQEKTVKTQPIAIENLPQQQFSKSRLKFAMKISKIGDFVPMRLWKYSGVQCLQLGTFDIPLSFYRLGKHGITSPQGGSQQIKWQQKQGFPELGRAVLTGQLTTNLRKSNTHQLDTKIRLKYRIYSKRFTQLPETPPIMD